MIVIEFLITFFPMCDSYCNIDIVVDDILEDTSDHWPLICVFNEYRKFVIKIL